jgi:eukaryotic-like serine/threonine-protein kinase
LDGLRQRILEWYETDADPEVHAAAAWLLQQSEWGRAARTTIDRRLAAIGDSNIVKQDWYLGPNGHAMAIRGPETFFMGRHDAGEREYTKFERAHLTSINRRFAIAMHETTRAQFEATEVRWPAEPGTTDPRCPASGVSWQMAAAYCNWLSEQAHMSAADFCYVSDKGVLREADDALNRQGYRLPTEAEWECACRAGTVTPLYFGAVVDLLPRYECCLANSNFGRRRAVGIGLPNGAGLFDMMGNACEWCHDPFGEFPPDSKDPSPDVGRPYRVVIDDSSLAKLPDWKQVFARGTFVLRGHAAGDPDDYLQYFRDRAPANHEGQHSIGFRVARTMPQVRPKDSMDTGTASSTR